MEETQKTHRRVVRLMASVIVVAGFLFARHAWALSIDNTGSSVGLGTADLLSTVTNVINWVLGLLGLVAVSYIIYAGYQWLTAGGNEERITKAKKILTNAVIGLVVILFAWAIVNFIINGDSNSGNTNDGGPGDSGSCTVGSDCSDCVNGQYVYNPNKSTCVLPQDVFEIRNITTSCGNPGASYQDDVFLCSSVSILFNQVVKTDNLQQLVESPGVGQTPLTVEQCADATCTTVSQPSPLFSSEAPTIAYSGDVPTGTKAEFVANGKSASFVHAHQLYTANTTYRLTIPLALTSSSGKALTSTGCKQTDGSPVPGCIFDAQKNAFEWIFHVGTNTDTTAPKPVSAYPQFSGTGYPDRNVSRAPIITMQFDEAIAPWTLTNKNIQIRPVTGANDQGEGGDVGQPVAGYDVQPTGTGFELSFTDGKQLEPFTWYEISTSGIRDLCLNAADPKAWRFQTNGVGLGIAQVYPTDGYKYACVDTEMFVQFNTSMYDPRTSSCAVLAAGGGYVTGGAQIPPRAFQVEDDIPSGQNINPNDYCRKYSWLATSDKLNPDAAYQPSVATRVVIDSNGTLLAKSWSFATKKAGECANAPYISELSPPSGQVGRCLSIVGGNFQKTQGANTLAFQKPDGMQQNIPNTDIKGWSNASIVTNAPDVGATALPFSSAVSVSVDYGSPIGILTSTANPAAQFLYNTTGAYTGPCLYSVNPTSAYRNDAFSYHGERFDKNSSVKTVHFDGNKIVGTWTNDSDGTASVPTAASYGQNNVSVENDGGRSNELPFSVLKVPPGAFQVNSVAPSCGGNVSCTNAAIYAAMSQSIASPLPAGSVELRLCTNEQCTVLDPNAVDAQASIDGAVNRIVITPHDPLARSAWYRAILHGGESGIHSTAGALLTSLNHDSNADGTNDAYSWTFGTTAGADVCTAATVQCQPESASIAESGTRQLSSHPFSSPNSCDNAGTELDGTKIAWTWSSADPAYVSVSPDRTTIGDQPVTTATGVKATPLGQTIAVTTTGDGKNAQCRLTVSNLSCETDSDCVANAKNSNLGQCTGSVCSTDTHLCTPVVKSISPTKGASGSWITVRGCYFGSYIDGSSKVLFEQKDKPELTGKWPAEAFCGPTGSTWHDDQIIVQAPEILATASTLRVQRSDTKTADSLTQFDPTGTKGPGLCSVTPANGQAGKTIGVALKGVDFGNGSGTNDAVQFYRTINVPASATTWAADGTTIGTVAVPSGAENNLASDYNEIAVMAGSAASNGLNFDLTTASCVACSDTDNSMCNAKQACGTVQGSRCCADRPIIASYAPKNPPATCTNASVTASFVDNAGQPLAMDASTISATTVTLAEKADASKTVTLSDFRFPTTGTFLASPASVLQPNTTYHVSIAGTVTSEAKVALDGGFGWDFTTKADGDPCPVASVVVAPPSFLFTDLGEQQTATATAYDATGQLIHPVESYSWTWEWAMDDSGVASVPAGIIVDQAVLTSVKNGTTSVRATANISDGKKKSGTAPVTVNACKDPWDWQGTGSVTRPYTPFSNNAMHFSTWYCKDGGTMLPDLTWVAGQGTDSLLWQFFFKNPVVNPTTHVQDAVGLMVRTNPDHLSPAAWYKQQFRKDGGSATSQVSGYEAMRVGTTMYIAGTNYDGSKLYTNMYVLGYNDGAGSDVVDIYNQMLADFTLNSNSSDFAYHDKDSDADVDSSTALQQLRRDTKRMADLASLGSTLSSYDAANGTFPQFSSGSYVSNMSTSVWPSWQQTLASALQQKVSGATVPVDPKNDLAMCTSGDKCTDNKCASGLKTGQACTADDGCSPYEPSTCWAEPLKLFQCPTGSHIYTYDVTNAGEHYDLYAHLEYRGAGSYATGTPDYCGFLVDGTTQRTDCACYSFQQTGDSTGTPGYNDTTRPSTPTKPTIDSFTANTVAISWTAANDYGGSGIQWYDIWRSVDGATYVNVARINGQTVSYADTGLASAILYYYKVSAHDNAGNDSYRSDPAIQQTGS